MKNSNVGQNLIIFLKIPIEFHAIIILCHIRCLKAMETLYDGWVCEESHVNVQAEYVPDLGCINFWINSEF